MSYCIRVITICASVMRSPWVILAALLWILVKACPGFNISQPLGSVVFEFNKPVDEGLDGSYGWPYYPQDTTIDVTCDLNTRLLEYSKITCESDATWNASLPICQGLHSSINVVSSFATLNVLAITLHWITLARINLLIYLWFVSVLILGSFLQSHFAHRGLPQLQME